MKKYLLVTLVVLLASCKSKTVLAEGNATKSLDAAKILKNHYANATDFKTMYIKANARYKDDKNSQSVTAEIRIQKDEKILVSVRVLGFTMAKALITPTSVQYYEKLGSAYFEGDYSALSKWLGTDLDFQKLQNLFLGKPLYDLKNQKLKAEIVNNLYQLKGDSGDMVATYDFEADNFLLKNQQFNQLSQNRKLQVSYPDYNKFGDLILPLSIILDANQNQKNTNIQLEYKTVNLNEELSFPYSVPDGYERISLDK
jgi:outer membrane biogenesis lipoprotein LolB